jgi:hypothetical protein
MRSANAADQALADRPSSFQELGNSTCHLETPLLPERDPWGVL